MSWYVRSASAPWEETGGVAVTAGGDHVKSHRELFPLTYSMAALPNLGTQWQKAWLQNCHWFGAAHHGSAPIHVKQGLL